MTPGWHYRHWHLVPAAVAVVLAALVAYSGLLFNTLAVAMLLGAAGAVLRRLYWLVRGRLVWPFTRTWRASPLPYQALNRTLFWALAAASFFPAVVREQLGAEYPAAMAVYGAASVLLIVLAWTAGPRVSVVRNGLTLAASLFLAIVLVGYHSSPREAVTLASPFASGEWLVAHGGRSPIANHHFAMGSQRHAIDFIGADAAAEAWRRPEEHPAFGRELVAPADGRVAHVVDGHPDQRVGGSDRKNPAGNYVSIEIAPGRFVVLAHLQRGSLAAGPEERVTKGMPLARVGNSGNTSEPHLHIQVQNVPEMKREGGVRTYPMRFDAEVRYRARAEWSTEAAADLRRGDRIRGAPSGPRLAIVVLP